MGAKPGSPRKPALLSFGDRLQLALGAVALGLFLLASRYPGRVDRVFSRGIFPRLAGWIAGLTEEVPFSLAEIVFASIVLLLLLSPFAGYRAARRRGNGAGRSLLAAPLHLLAAAVGIWTLFLVLWGFNYARPGVARTFGLPRGPLAKDKSEALVAKIGDRLDSIRKELPEDGEGVVASAEDWEELDGHLAALEARVLAEHGLPSVDAGRAKCFLASRLMLRWGVSGVYGPFTAEPNVVLPSAPARLPFTLAHERAHLQGFAREDDASFVALLTVWRSDRADVRYSGWLELWMALRERSGGRSPGVRRDLAAIARFYAERRGREERVVSKAYDRYLKGHGVAEGLGSYGAVASAALRYLDATGLPAEPPPDRGTRASLR